MLDPLVAADVSGGGVSDGLPECLTDYLREDGVRYLKVKIGGDPAQDLARLIRVAETVEAARGKDYAITLDGNEQYRDAGLLMQLLERVQKEPRLRTFLANTIFIEQPIPRDAAFDAALAADIERLSAIKPLVLDEADGHLEAFKEGACIGWRGVSAKNCKGVIQSLLNRSLVQVLSTRERPLLLSAEDLTVVPVIGLQQDLTTVATLGLSHVEKNGHHYVRGCAHCTPQERQGVKAYHTSLYQQIGNELFLHIQQGQVDLTSLQCPGFGVGFEVDTSAFPRWSAWVRRTPASA
ncbi:MAG TPA: mandelate racemase, partial [bacterium]